MKHKLMYLPIIGNKVGSDHVMADTSISRSERDMLVSRIICFSKMASVISPMKVHIRLAFHS